MCPHCTEILSDNANKKQLDSTEEENAEHDRGHSKLERIPPDQFCDQVNKSDNQRESTYDKTEKNRETQWYFRMIDDAVHCNVIQRQEVVACDTVFPFVLDERDFASFESDFSDQTSEKWVRIVELPECFDKTTVIKSEAGKQS